MNDSDSASVDLNESSSTFLPRVSVISSYFKAEDEAMRKKKSMKSLEANSKDVEMDISDGSVLDEENESGDDTKKLDEEIVDDSKLPYSISLPPSDGLEYLEITYLVYRPEKYSTTLPWRIPSNSSAYPSSSDNRALPSPQSHSYSFEPASIVAIGRVYQRLLSRRVSSPFAPASLWIPTGDVRTVSLLKGDVVGRVYSQVWIYFEIVICVID